MGGHLAADVLTQDRRAQADTVIRGFVVCVIGLMLVLGSSAAGAPSWSAAVQLSSGERALGPELAMSTAGDAAVVWDQELGPDCAASPASLTCIHIVELTTRRRGTAAWAPPVELGRPGIGARPRVAIDDAGDALVAWVHDIGRDRVLQATFRSRSTSAWPEPNDLSEPVLGVQDFGIGLDRDGDAVAAWSERTAARIALRVATRSAASGVWGAAHTISRPAGNVSGGPAVAVTDGGIAVVLWIEDGVVRETRGNIRSDFWFPPTQVSPGRGEVAFGSPDIALDQATGEIVAVWASRTGAACCRVEAASYASGPGHWDQLGIGSLPSPSDTPRVAIGGARSAVAVWVGEAGIESARKDASERWSRPTLISARSTNVAAPDVSVDSRGNTIAVWTDTGVVEAALRPGVSGRWQLPVEISATASSGPQVALYTGGNALAVWSRRISQQVAVLSRDLSGRGPVLERVWVPRRVTVGHSARFSVRPTPWSAPLTGLPRWRFGDGRNARGVQVAHRYVRAGTYRVSVTSIDADGGTTTATRTIRVRRQPSSGS